MPALFSHPETHHRSRPARKTPGKPSRIPPRKTTYWAIRVAQLFLGALAAVCVLLTPGCDGGQAAEAGIKPRAAAFQVTLLNRTGHRIEEVYVYRGKDPMSFGRVAAGGIESQRAVKQDMPEKLEIEWLNPETGEYEWVIVYIEKTFGKNFHGSVVISLNGHNDWDMKKGA